MSQAGPAQAQGLRWFRLRGPSVTYQRSDVNLLRRVQNLQPPRGGHYTELLWQNTQIITFLSAGDGKSDEFGLIYTDSLHLLAPVK